MLYALLISPILCLPCQTQQLMDKLPLFTKLFIFLTINGALVGQVVSCSVD